MSLTDLTVNADDVASAMDFAATVLEFSSAFEMMASHMMHGGVELRSIINPERREDDQADADADAARSYAFPVQTNDELAELMPRAARSFMTVGFAVFYFPIDARRDEFRRAGKAPRPRAAAAAPGGGDDGGGRGAAAKPAKPAEPVEPVEPAEPAEGDGDGGDGDDACDDDRMRLPRLVDPRVGEIRAYRDAATGEAVLTFHPKAAAARTGASNAAKALDEQAAALKDLAPAAGGAATPQGHGGLPDKQDDLAKQCGTYTVVLWPYTHFDAAGRLVPPVTPLVERYARLRALELHTDVAAIDNLRPPTYVRDQQKDGDGAQRIAVTIEDAARRQADRSRRSMMLDSRLLSLRACGRPAPPGGDGDDGDGKVTRAIDGASVYDGLAANLIKIPASWELPAGTPRPAVLRDMLADLDEFHRAIAAFFGVPLSQLPITAPVSGRVHAGVEVDQRVIRARVRHLRAMVGGLMVQVLGGHRRRDDLRFFQRRVNRLMRLSARRARDLKRAREGLARIDDAARDDAPSDAELTALERQSAADIRRQQRNIERWLQRLQRLQNVYSIVFPDDNKLDGATLDRLLRAGVVSAGAFMQLTLDGLAPGVREIVHVSEDRADEHARHMRRVEQYRDSLLAKRARPEARRGGDGDDAGGGDAPAAAALAET